MIHLKHVYPLSLCPMSGMCDHGRWGSIHRKKLGIDDLLVSIWLSGLNTAIAFWFASVMKNRLLKNGYGWSVAFFVLTVGSLVYTKQIGHVGNTYLGVDKILVGLTVGFAISLIAILIDRLIRIKNKGKVLFYYQKVIIPLVLLIITTGIFKYLVTIFRK